MKKIGEKFNEGGFSYEVTGYDAQGRCIAKRIGKAVKEETAPAKEEVETKDEEGDSTEVKEETAPAKRTRKTKVGEA